MKSLTKMNGMVEIVLRDARTNKVKDRREIHNIVVDTGLNWIAHRMMGAADSATAAQQMKWAELGLGSASPASGDTDLQTTFVPSSRMEGVHSLVGNATWQLTVDWGTSDANTAGIKEAAVFGSALQGSGIMLARTTFAAINKTNQDTLKLRWRIAVEDDGI